MDPTYAVRAVSTLLSLPHVAVVHDYLLSEALDKTPNRNLRQSASDCHLSYASYNRGLDTLVRWGWLRASGKGSDRQLTLTSVPNIRCLEEVLASALDPETLAEWLPKTGRADDLEAKAELLAFILHPWMRRYELLSGGVTVPYPEAGDGGYVTVLPVVYLELRFDLNQEEPYVPTLEWCYELSQPALSTRRGKAAKDRMDLRRAKPIRKGTDLMYYSAKDLELDTAYFPAITAVLDEYNQAFKANYRVNWKLYLKIRDLMVTDGFTEEQLVTATHLGAREKYWVNVNNPSSFYADATRIQQFVDKASKHDPFARTLPGQAVRGPDEAFAF